MAGDYVAMFVCPKCGYRDLPCWRAHRYFLYAVYCRIDELSEYMPELAERLRREKDVDFGVYTYHLTSSGYVLRILTELKAFIYRRDLIEKHMAAKDPRQQTLSP